MDQELEVRQGARAPQYSPDGRWYWDGTAWRPVLHQAAPSGRRHRWRPGRRYYLLAVLALALAALLAAVAVPGWLWGFPWSATHIHGPGTTEMRLPAPGTYTISLEGGGEPLEAIPPPTLSLVSATSGAKVDLHTPPTRFGYGKGDIEGEAIAEFQIDHPGTYALTSEYPSGESDPLFVLAIAQGSPLERLRYLFGGLAAIALLITGTCIALAILILRLVQREPS